MTWIRAAIATTQASAKAPIPARTPIAAPTSIECGSTRGLEETRTKRMSLERAQVRAIENLGQSTKDAIEFKYITAPLSAAQEAELFQNMLAQIGVTMKISVVPINDFFDKYVTPGQFDFIGAVTHEIFHGLGIQGCAEFVKYVTNVNGINYFNGPNTVAALGRPLPMGSSGGTHYGNTSLPDNPINSGLMFQWGNYAGNRLDIGRLDLMILKDMGTNVCAHHTQRVGNVEEAFAQAAHVFTERFVVDRGAAAPMECPR